jgi:copper chaperone CopZ
MKYSLIALMILFTSITFAQNKNAKATLEVEGVCTMCKSRIEKAAIRTKGVKSAIWSVESKRLSLIFNNEKTNLDQISKSVANAGHDNKIIKATDEAYNKVHPCCRYRDEDVKSGHKVDKPMKG